MDPKYDRDDEDLDATVRNLRTFADRPGDISFRQSIAGGFEKVNDRLGKIDVRLARIDERQINRTTVAEIVRTEVKSIEKDVNRLESMVWAIAGAGGTAVLGVITYKLFGH
jgi:hypothetical protein